MEQSMQLTTKLVVLDICWAIDIKCGLRVPLLTYDNELTPSTWTMGGNICPSRVMLTASWTSSGDDVVVAVTVADDVIGVGVAEIVVGSCRLNTATPSNCA